MKLIATGLDEQKLFDKTAAEARSTNDYSDKADFLEEALEHGNKRQQALNEAIRLTCQLYKISPADRAVQNGPLAGRDAKWAPQFYDDGFHFRLVLDPAGNKHYLDFPQNLTDDRQALATTIDDGEVAVRLLAFQRAMEDHSPRFLATILYHESVHFERLVTVGWEAAKETEEAEAYAAELANAKRLNLSADQMAELRGLKDASANAAARITPTNYTSSFTGPFQEDFNEKGFQQFPEWNVVLRREIREVRSHIIQGPSREESERKIRWARLTTWTLRACTYIQDVHPGDPEWGNGPLIEEKDKAAREYLRNNLVVLGKDELAEDVRSNPNGLLWKGGDYLATCQMSIINTIQDIPGPVDVDWLLAKIDYEKGGGKEGHAISNLINGIGRAIRDGTIAIVKSLNQPMYQTRPSGWASEPSGGNNSGNRGGGGGGNREPGGSGHSIAGGGVAYGQLRGIGGGASWH